MSEFEKQSNYNKENIDVILKKEGRIHSFRTECNQDFILPDYMGDIKKLLNCYATITPCNKFVSESEISFLNLVTFRVLYLDSENLLTEANFTQDCEINEKTASGVLDADVETRVQNTTVRLGGPRKISAKASLISDISYLYEDDISYGADLKNAERKNKKIQIHSLECLRTKEREYAEQMGVISEVTSDEVEVIKYDAEAFIDSVYKTESGINISGCINAFCILRVGSDIMRLEKCIPIEEGIENDMSDNCACFARAYVSGAHVNINNGTDEKNSGECFVSVVMNMSAECVCTCHFNKEYEIVSDAFLENNANENSYRTYSYNEMIGSASDKRKISFSYKRSENSLHDIIDKDFRIKNVKCIASDNEVSISADAEFCIIARDAKDGSCYSEKFNENIVEKIKIDGLKESSAVRAYVTPCEFSPSFDNEKIYIETYISLFCIAEESKGETVLSSLLSKEIKDENERVVYVYYPDENDTLWQVAKKYSVCESKILKYNPNLSVYSENDAKLSNVDNIIIVK